MFRVAITDCLFSDSSVEEEVFSGHSLEVLDRKKREEWESRISEMDALLVNMAPIDGTLISSMKRCQVISRYGSGFDNVDVAEASSKGIFVATVPDYCSAEVAEHALALLLSCARAIPSRNTLVHKGQWRCGSLPLGSRRVAGSVLGILGYGRTGRALHRYCTGFGFSRVLVHSRHLCVGETLPTGALVVSYETLLQEADYLSVHLPLTESTYHMLGEDSLTLMKEGSVLINTSRGGVLDEEILYRALTSGPLRSAGIDVMEREPPPPDHPLLSLDNLIVSDHQAFYSEQSVITLRRKTAENALAVLTTGKPFFAVNHPIEKSMLTCK